MIFEQESIGFQILDVLYFEQYDISRYNSKRNFDALSFRYEADTVIEHNGKTIDFCDNVIGFFPANTNYTRTTNHDKMIVIHFKTYNYTSLEIEKFSPEDAEKYRILFKTILDCWRKKGISYKHEAASVLNLIFAELYRDNKKADAKNLKIEPSIRYIEENYLRKDFSPAKAAEKAFISEQYFRKLFKREFGVSPKQYVINKRIKYAASLIIAGYYSLSEIADYCGYNDYKHFAVEFKKIIGVSPSEYVYDYND